MGFLDKAKQLADQAQAKLDEVQKQFNESQPRGQQPSGGSAVEYDEHGRKVTSPAGPSSRGPEGETAPHGDPIAGQAPPPPADKGPELREEPTDPGSPQGDALAEPRKPPVPPSPGSGLTSGDPLGG